MNNLSKKQQSLFQIGFLLLSSIGYYLIAYRLERTDHLELLFIYSALFGAYIFMYFKMKGVNGRQILWSGLILRGILFLSLPNLSDDFYRFIWDGLLLNGGENPFHHLPGYFIENPHLAPEGINQALFNFLNSQNHFTIYPPLHQFIFWVSTMTGAEQWLNSVVFMRIFLLLAETGSYFLIIALLKHYGRPIKYAALYFLNPLVIIEGIGNLHFEVVMVFFVLAAIYRLEKGKYFLTALFFTFAVGTKLIPLIFLPLLLVRISFRKALLIYFQIGLFSLILFLPFLDREWLEGFTDSFGLYFQKFEFNASIYYIVRWIGWQVVGFNIIGYAGKALAFIVFVLIILYTARQRSKREQDMLPGQMGWVLLIYLSFTTILHPWYIIPLVALGIFLPWRFTILWSFTIFFSYLSYTIEGVTENSLVLLLEYLPVIYFLAADWGILPRKFSPGFQL